MRWRGQGINAEDAESAENTETPVLQGRAEALRVLTPREFRRRPRGFLTGRADSSVRRRG